MSNRLQEAAAWLSQQQVAYAGHSCIYRHDAYSLELSLVPLTSDKQSASLDFVSDPSVSIRSDDFIATLGDFEIDGDEFHPQVRDEIEWTDERGIPFVSVVFPRVSQRCYRFTDPGKTILRIYTVAQDSLDSLQIHHADGTQFPVSAVLGAIRGGANFGNYGDENLLLTTVAYIPTVDLAATGLTKPPATAKFDCYGLDGWVIEMGLTEWGTGLVKLGLQRETLVREWQARRNATV